MSFTKEKNNYLLNGKREKKGNLAFVVNNIRRHLYGLLDKYGFSDSIFVSLMVLSSSVFWPIFYMVIYGF